ncbi:MAG: hypothetical protein WD651_05970 [Acidimicrobiia bacterium]
MSKDVSMLVLVEIKLEHNSVGPFGQLATPAREEWALRVRSGAVAHHDLVAQLFEKFPIDHVAPLWDIEKDVTLIHDLNSFCFQPGLSTP